jgi:hypothetical protein
MASHPHNLFLVNAGAIEPGDPRRSLQPRLSPESQEALQLSAGRILLATVEVGLRRIELVSSPAQEATRSAEIVESEFHHLLSSMPVNKRGEWAEFAETSQLGLGERSGGGDNNGHLRYQRVVDVEVDMAERFSLTGDVDLARQAFVVVTHPRIIRSFAQIHGVHPDLSPGGLTTTRLRTERV